MFDHKKGFPIERMYNEGPAWHACGECTDFATWLFYFAVDLLEIDPEEVIFTNVRRQRVSKLNPLCFMIFPCVCTADFKTCLH